jgi:putative ABC transport system permease protein
MKFVPLVLRNLVRNRRRTLLTVLSIAISVFVFAALISLPAVVRQILRDRISTVRMVCASKAGFSYTLPAAYGNKIRALPHVDAVTGYLLALATYRDPHVILPAVGVDPSQMRAMWPDWGISSDDAAALEHARTDALVTPKMLTRYRWKVGQRVILRGIAPPGKLEFTIVGVLRGRGAPDQAIIMPIDRLDQLPGNHGKVVAFLVRADHADSVPEVIGEIDSLFANSSFETITQSESQVAQQQLRSYRILFVGAEVIASIVAFVIALVAANTAAMTVRERRQELAVMRSIGFTRRMIVTFMVSEGFLIGLGAGLLGCAIAYVALRVAPHFANALGPFATLLHLLPSVAAESIALAAAIGLLSIAIPALGATRRDIAAALRAIG